MHTFSPETVALVAAKLIDQATHFAGLAQEARRAGLKDDAKYFQRAATAYTNALTEWRAGTRPEALGDNRWLLPSRSGGVSHLLTKSGDWACTCAAGIHDHWAKMLIVAIEIVLDEQAAYDSGDFDPVAEEVNDLIATTTFRPAPAGWQDLVDGYAPHELRERAYAGINELYA